MKPTLIGLANSDKNVDEQAFFRTKPEYDFYAKQDSWSPNEAVCLLHDLEPNTQFTHENWHISVGRRIEDYSEQPIVKSFNRCWATIARSELDDNSPAWWLSWGEQKGYNASPALTKAVKKYAYSDTPKTNSELMAKGRNSYLRALYMTLEQCLGEHPTKWVPTPRAREVISDFEKKYGQVTLKEDRFAAIIAEAKELFGSDIESSK